MGMSPTYWPRACAQKISEPVTAEGTSVYRSHLDLSYAIPHMVMPYAASTLRNSLLPLSKSLHGLKGARFLDLSRNGTVQ